MVLIPVFRLRTDEVCSSGSSDSLICRALEPVLVLASVSEDEFFTVADSGRIQSGIIHSCVFRLFRVDSKNEGCE